MGNPIPITWPVQKGPGVKQCGHSHGHGHGHGHGHPVGFTHCGRSQVLAEDPFPECMQPTLSSMKGGKRVEVRRSWSFTPLLSCHQASLQFVYVECSSFINGKNIFMEIAQTTTHANCEELREWCGGEMV